MNKLHHTAIVFQDLPKKGHRLITHSSLQRIIPDMVHTFQAIQPEPLTHEMAENRRACGSANMIHLRGKRLGLAQFAAPGQLQQFLIRYA